MTYMINGRQYLVVANGSTLDNSIHVFFNAGGGTFAAGIRYDVGYAPNALAIGDWDQDGDRDVLVTNGGLAINLMYNDGLGSFCYVEGGARRRIGAFPTGDPFFTGPCDNGAA